MRDPKRTRRPRDFFSYLIVPLGFIAFLGLVFFLLYFNDELDRRLLADATDKVKTENSSAVMTTAKATAKSEYSHQQVESSHSRPAASSQSAPAPKATKPKPSQEQENPKSKDKVYWRAIDDLYSEIQDRRHNPSKYNSPICRLIVFLDEQYVAAYGLNDQGKEVLLRTFPCSGGLAPGHTPLGQHSLGAKWPDPWLFDNSRAQYGAQISGNILFHSLPSYDGSLKSGLKLSDLNSMGYAASHGCVRLFCMDAKWLYDNAEMGCPVEVLQNRGETYKNLPAHVFYLRLKDGAPKWDPTDPDPDNPYHDKKLLEKWAVAEPWLQDYKVIPPVWPDFGSNSIAQADPELEVTEHTTTAVSQPLYTGPTSPLPPPRDAQTEASVGETSPLPPDQHN